MIVPSILCEIQESDKGHWHIPVSEEALLEKDRTWLCVTRQNSQAQWLTMLELFRTSWHIAKPNINIFFLNTQVSISSALSSSVWETSSIISAHYDF
jgi:hypothetical protein